MCRSLVWDTRNNENRLNVGNEQKKYDRQEHNTERRLYIIKIVFANPSQHKWTETAENRSGEYDRVYCVSTVTHSYSVCDRFPYICRALKSVVNVRDCVPNGTIPKIQRDQICCPSIFEHKTKSELLILINLPTS